MWTVIDGYDRTDVVNDDLTAQLSISDPLSKADFTVDDATNSLPLDVLQNVIIFDENQGTGLDSLGNLGNQTIPIVPSDNYCVNVLLENNGAGSTHIPVPFTTSGPNAGLFFWTNNTFNVTQTFTNAPVGNGLATQQTILGYIRPGVTYTYSIYVLGSGTISNLKYYTQMIFQDLGGNTLGSVISTTGNPTLSQQRISISGLAPAGTAYITFSFGGNATVNASNSGAITFYNPQVEPNWFSSRGVSYPTPDCNFATFHSALMPDGTSTRLCRVFSGWIDDVQGDYTDGQRLLTVSCTSLGAILENGALVSADYSTGAWDDTIIKGVIDTYFPTLLSYTNIHYQSEPFTVQRGIQISGGSFVDATFRELLNSIGDQSGFLFFVDAYAHVHYNPVYWDVGTVTLSDSPDYVTSFSYQDYTFEKDATQIKNRVKVIGGKAISPAIADTFSPNGTNKVFTLTQFPYAIQSCTVSGASQKGGTSGVNTFSSGGYAYLVNKSAGTITFNTAPASGTNTLVVTYTYEAPVCVQVLSQESYTKYNRWFDSKVNDSTIVTIASAIARGQAEITKFALPRPILTITSDQYFPAGTTVLFTSVKEGYTNQPFTIQALTATYRVLGQNLYQYTAGYYNPTFIDHLRNQGKALNRSLSTAGVNTPQQICIDTSETIYYGESVSATPSTPPTNYVYGTALYGYSVFI